MALPMVGRVSAPLLSCAGSLLGTNSTPRWRSAVTVAGTS
eukprot:gene7527-9590_t